MSMIAQHRWYRVKRSSSPSIVVVISHAAISTDASGLSWHVVICANELY